MERLLISLLLLACANVFAAEKPKNIIMVVGDGMGPAQPYIYPPPLNFTILKGREISGGIIYYQLMNGITGTAMPYFKNELESQKLWEVGEYVASYFINQSDANQEPRGIDAAYEP